MRTDACAIPAALGVAIAEPDAYELPGLPRPLHCWDREYSTVREGKRCPQLPDRLPVPWINGPVVRDHGDWHAFRDDAVRAHHERLCVICGNPLNARILFGSFGGERKTAGPGGHPKCIRMALATCPHLVEQNDPDAAVAWEYVGSGLGYELPSVCGHDYLEHGYGSGENIVSEARPLTRAQAAEIAKADPWGRLPEDPGRAERIMAEVEAARAGATERSGTVGTPKPFPARTGGSVGA